MKLGGQECLGFGSSLHPEGLDFAGELHSSYLAVQIGPQEPDSILRKTFYYLDLRRAQEAQRTLWKPRSLFVQDGRYSGILRSTLRQTDATQCLRSLGRGGFRPHFFIIRCQWLPKSAEFWTRFGATGLEVLNRSPVPSVP